MGDLKKRINTVRNTLQQLTIQSTEANLGMMLGSLTELERIREEIPDNILDIMRENAALREQLKQAKPEPAQEAAEAAEIVEITEEEAPEDE